MRIHLFVSHYPVPYKPYYDAQFADLVRRGHEITIFSGGTLDEVVNEKVVQFDLMGRTRFFPTTLSSALRQLPRILGDAAVRPRELRLAAAVARSGRGVRRGMADAARVLATRGPTPDLCLVHGLGTAIMFPWLRAVYPGLPIALYYHGGEVPATSPLNARLASEAFDLADVVFTNTHFSRDHAISRGCSAERCVVLPVGFDLADFQPPSPRTYRRGGVLRLLSAGRMSEEKGFIYALRALQGIVDGGVRDIEYALTGEGRVRPALEAYVRESGLERHVRFLGTLLTRGVQQAMAEADALLLPSIKVGNWVENQACAVQEAMLMKALVVVTRTGGVPDSIPECMRRFMVPEADADALAEAIRAVHALPSRRLAELGEEGRAFVVQNYDIRKIDERLIELTLAAGTARVDGSRRPPESAAAAQPA